MDKFLTADQKKQCDEKVALYETKRASLLEILHIFQEIHGHITLEMEEAIAGYLGIAPIDVREVVTFYTLYYTKPKAKTRFNVCHTLSCSLLGADDLIKHMEEKVGCKAGQQTEDGKFEIKRVECLGACEFAPMMQVNDDKYEHHLTKEKIDQIIEGRK